MRKCNIIIGFALLSQAIVAVIVNESNFKLVQTDLILII